MHLTLHIPDELAARLQAAGGDIERQAIDALCRTADELERGRPRAALRPDADATGAALIAAFQASPARDIELTPARGPSPVRDVTV